MQRGIEDAVGMIISGFCHKLRPQAHLIWLEADAYGWMCCQHFNFELAFAADKLGNTSRT